jgi:cytidylate kinase
MIGAISDANSMIDEWGDRERRCCGRDRHDGRVVVVGLVVAVDGPSGSGKSTVSRGLAQALGARYLDTGAMYRAVTWAVLQAAVDPADAETVTKIAVEAVLAVGTDPADPHITINGTNVDGVIRGAEVTAAVSAVSAVPGVRQTLVARQREIIAAALGGIVVEGRDIGAVVAPDADLKVYLTADAGERARRRSTEQAADLDATAADMERRDRLDSTRAADPLAQASDAVVLDSTELGVAEVLARLTALLRERRLA